MRDDHDEYCIYIKIQRSAAHYSQLVNTLGKIVMVTHFNDLTTAPIFVKIRPMLTDILAWKATKVCKIQTQVWHILTCSWPACLAARPLLRWQECTRLRWLHLLPCDVMGVRFRTVRGITYGPEKTHNLSRHARIPTPREDALLVRVTRRRRHATSRTDPSSPVERGPTNTNKHNKKSPKKKNDCAQKDIA